MSDDPYRHQRRTKSLNRAKIFDALSVKPSTFGELQTSVGMSKVGLSGQLGELEKDGFIERRLVGRRIEYTITQRGQVAALMRKTTIREGLRRAGRIVQNPETAAILNEMTKMATDKPDQFQTLMNWALNLFTYTTSNPVFESRWLKILGTKGAEEWRPFKEEIKKRSSISPMQAKTSEELQVALDNVMDGIKKVFEEDKARKTRR